MWQSRHFCLPQSWPCQGLDLVRRFSSLSPAFSTILSLYPVRLPSFSSASLSCLASLLPAVYGTNMTAFTSGTDPIFLVFFLVASFFFPSPLPIIFLGGKCISFSSSSSSLSLSLNQVVFSTSFFLFLDFRVDLACL